tara:strand:+ start:410 stop:598 length:189 start_codon:yes stop_codon:yes gene_type:complete
MEKEMSDEEWAIIKTKFMMLWKLKQDQEQLDKELQKPQKDNNYIKYLEQQIKLSASILDPNY